MNQYALGSAITVPYSPGVASREKTSGALFLKAGEIRLFQLPDLKIDLVGLSLRKKSSLLSIIFSSLSSPLGGEKLASLLWQNAKWEKSAFEVGFNLYVQDLKGMKRETLLGASFGMFLPVTKSLAMGYRVRNIAIFGEEHRGADVSVFIGITALSGVHGYPVLSLRRNQEIGFGFAGSMALLAGRAGLAFGYDDSTGELRAALTLQVRSVQISTGAGLHPVLGISEGLTVTWGL